MLPKRKPSGGDGDSSETVIHGHEGGPSPAPAPSPFNAPRHDSMKSSPPNMTGGSSVKATENHESGLKVGPFSHAVSNHKTSSIETGFSQHGDTVNPSASPFAGLSTKPIQAASSPVQDGSEETIDREVSGVSPYSGTGNLGEKDSDGDQHTSLSHDVVMDSSSRRNHSLDDSLSSDTVTGQDQDSSGGSSGGSIKDFLDSSENGEDEEVKPRKWPWVLAVGIVILLVAGVGIGIWASSNDGPKKIDNSSQVSNSKINKSNGNDASQDGDQDSDSAQQRFMKSIDVPEFYRQPKADSTKEQKEEAVQYALATEPQNAVGRFQSKDSNPDLTDDPSQYLLKDGSVNPNYSYLTGENTTAVIRDDMERLINPVYGGWTFLQDSIRQDVDGYGQSVDSLALADMFDPSISFGSESDYRDHARLYADWDSNEYGGEWAGKESNTPIVGTVVDYDCDYNVTGSMDDTISCTAKIRYSGKVTDSTGKEVVKSVDKNLKLNYKVNYDGDVSPRRVLLTSVDQ